MHYLEAELLQEISCNPDTWGLLQRATTDGMWCWDLENPDHEWMSPEFWRLFGYDPTHKAHLSREWRDMIHPEDEARSVENLKAHCADPDHPYDQIVRYTHRDGSTVWVRCRGMAIRDASGRAIRMIGAHNRVTTVSAAPDESAALKAANAELRSFAYALSHDLKSPANTVSMLLRELERSDGAALSHGGAEDLTLAQQTVGRMQGLVDSLLSYASLVSPRGRMRPVELAELMEETLQDMAAAIQSSGARVTVGDLPSVNGDRVQLRLALQNLLGNAIKYAKPGENPQVHVHAPALPQDADQAEIHVSDQGVGVPSASHDHIFEPFKRLHGMAEVEGKGLGLALCRRIATNHGGTITLQSAPGDGATFIVKLPRITA
ncbi:MAG: ATP-binding protein [Pseudomonadota bacterium]